MRNFLRTGICILLLSIALIYTCHAQDSAFIKKYQPQLDLIDSIRIFIKTDLRLHVQSTYYTEWNNKDEDSMYLYLYISRSDKVQEDTAIGKYMVMSKEANAIAKCRELEVKGYQTMLYKTAGNSTARLSAKLLSYPPEAIAYILFHEAVHQNVKREGGRIPYAFEEALCDVVANSACMRFSEKTKMIAAERVKKQQEIFEKAYTYLNRQRQILDTMRQETKPAFFKACTTAIHVMTSDANQFQKDRLNYQVNNAYFLRIDDYARNYFIIKKLYSSHFDFKETIEKIIVMKK